MSSQVRDGEGTGTDRAARIPKGLAILSVVVLVAGLVVLGVFGWRYAEARSAQDVATERDTVSDVASQVIINAFSFDHRSVDESLENLAEVSTGDFLAEQEQWAADVRTRVVEQKAVTTATVSHAAVESLDTAGGQAKVLVVFTAHSEREGEDPITGRQAMSVDLSREDSGWKATALNQVGVTVPVGESSQSVQELEGPPKPEGGAADTDPDKATESEETSPTSAPATSGGR